MSHVIGQGTIASNHYRTSEYRASQYETPQVFNSEKTEFNSTESTGIKNAAKQLAALLPKLRKKLADGDAVSDSIKKLLKNNDEDIMKKLDNIFKNPDVDPNDFGWLRKIMKNEKLTDSQTEAMSKSLRGVKSSDDFLDAALNKKSLKDAADSLQQGIDAAADFSPRQKTLLKYTTGTAVGITTIGMLIFGPGSDILNKWANYSTGLDCPEKAAGRGYEEGTPEYAEAVKTCQEGTMASLMKLGYGALAIVGFVGLIAVTRAIPKRKAKKEPEEDSEDEE